MKLANQGLIFCFVLVLARASCQAAGLKRTHQVCSESLLAFPLCDSELCVAWRTNKLMNTSPILKHSFPQTRKVSAAQHVDVGS